MVMENVLKETVRNSKFSPHFLIAIILSIFFLSTCTKSNVKNSRHIKAENYLTSFGLENYGLDYTKSGYSFAIRYPDKSDFGKNFTASFVLLSISERKRDFMDELITFLKKQRTKNGRWSFDSHGISTDSDTTLTVLLSLIEKNSIRNEDILKTIETLKKSYWRNCGLASLNNTKKHSNFTSHFEPSANYITLMSHLKSNSDNLNCFAEDILKNQNKNGSFSAYWYPSKSYASYLGGRALSKYLDSFSFTEEAANRLKKRIKLAANYLKKNQNSDGSWGEGEAKPMETAFAVLALKETKKHHNFTSEMTNGIKYLKNSQNSDGSWSGTAFFNYYYTQCEGRSCPENWHDRKRKLISTSAALRALKVNAL